MIYRIEFTVESEYRGWFYYADDLTEAHDIIDRFRDEHILDYEVIYCGKKRISGNEEELYFSLRKFKCEPKRKKLFCTIIKVPDEIAIIKDKEYYSGIFEDYHDSVEASKKVIQDLCDEFGYDRFALKCCTNMWYLNEEIDYKAFKKGD